MIDRLFNFEGDFLDLDTVRHVMVHDATPVSGTKATVQVFLHGLTPEIQYVFETDAEAQAAAKALGEAANTWFRELRALIAEKALIAEQARSLQVAEVSFRGTPEPPVTRLPDLQQDQILVRLYGLPGVGKSTLARRIEDSLQSLCRDTEIQVLRTPDEHDAASLVPEYKTPWQHRRIQSLRSRKLTIFIDERLCPPVASENP